MTVEAPVEAPEFEPVPLMEDLPSEDIPLEMEDDGGYVEELDISEKEELDVEVYFIFFTVRYEDMYTISKNVANFNSLNPQNTSLFKFLRYIIKFKQFYPNNFPNSMIFVGIKIILVLFYDILLQMKEEEVVSTAKPVKPRTAVLSVEKEKSQPKRVFVYIAPSILNFFSIHDLLNDIL